ncbi:uncharacterized protein TRIADDRAFT_62062 [Trichoplax adhaerens]|uniref:SH2 domain-containing protein n=1 Tax=Trichoplax adhaerens TaxID=10228 RepID=B3SCQ7_TRIAD|nr:hypothetical protein TRIADDRAFT_62062 [Trichoplax adhaerens]EDV19496.1 hypothetical protein TRIADDRAFT_62062 [Trichoplax adhaerens]|eukprot:XP_002118013.1 hypothetical protein TRIADDRAFT_62062 [Trichoplax adhaerens]
MDSDDDIYDCMLESSVKLVYDRILPKLERQLPTKNFCKGAFKLGIIDYDKVLTASHEHISPDINRKILEYIDSEQLDDIKDWLSIMFDDEKCRPIAYEFINELSEWKLEELVENINIKDGYILISDKLISVSKLDSVQMDVDEPVIIVQDSISRKSFPINKDHSVDVPIHAEDIKHKVNVSVPFPIHYRPMSTEIDIFPLVTRFTAMASASLVIKTWLQLPDSTSDQGNIRDCQLTCWIPHYKQIKQLFCKSEKSVQQNDKIIVARRINSDSTKFTEIGTKFSIDENKATDDGVVVKCNCSYQSVINWFWKIPQWLLDAARLGPKYYYDYFRYPVQYFVGVKPMKDKPGHFTLIALVKNIRCPLPSRIGDELELLASSGDETRLLSSGRLQINLAGDIKPLNGLIWVELLNKIAYFDGMYSVTQFACMGHFDADNGIYSKGSVEFRYIDPGPNCHPDASNPDYNVENESVVVEFSYAIDHEMTRKYSIIRGNVSDPETTGKVDARSPQPDPFTDTPMHNSKELSQNLSLIDSIEDTRHLWYQEDMTKVNAIVFLQDQPIGTFVVRKSTRHHCEAISVKVTVDGNIGHFLFKNNSNEWSIADFERKFVSLEDLLTHYTNNKDKELQVKLRFPRPIHSNAKVEPETQSLPGEISDCTMQHVSIQDYNEVSNLEKFEYILSDSEENTGLSIELWYQFTLIISK